MKLKIIILTAFLIISTMPEIINLQNLLLLKSAASVQYQYKTNFLFALEIIIMKGQNAVKNDPPAMITLENNKITASRKCTSGDCYNGTGTFIWKNGNSYTGQWNNGKRHGRGKMTWLVSTVYNSEKMPDKTGYNPGIVIIDEKGIAASITGGIWIIGEVAKDQIRKSKSMGTVMDNEYTGEWHNDMMQGNGTLLLKPGFIITGRWKNNEFIGE